MNIIEAEWQKYFKALHPRGASDIQKRETHKAFVAGAASVFALIGDAAKVEGEAESVRVLSEIAEGLHEQLERIIASGVQSRN